MDKTTYDKHVKTYDKDFKRRMTNMSNNIIMTNMSKKHVIKTRYGTHVKTNIANSNKTYIMTK